MFCLPAERKRQKTYTAVIKKHETFQVSYCEIPIISQQMQVKNRMFWGDREQLEGLNYRRIGQK